MPKIGGKRKKTRTHKEIEEDAGDMGKIPKSFIFKRGKVFPLIKDVVQDMREVMYPYTAIKLQESDKVKIKDYMKAASSYEISHFFIFTSTEKNNYLRLVKLPEGPTITFKILKYSTRKDILDSQEKKKIFSRNFSAPLLIINGFNEKIETPQEENNPSSSNYSVVMLMLQSMFPSLNIAKAHLNSLKRVVLFHLDNTQDVVHFRHYYIKKTPANINKNIKKALETKKIPDLSKFNDISDYILKGSQNLNEQNNNETNEGNESPLNDEKQQFSIRLHEIGPRLKLKLFKIEEGLLRGNVVFHRLIHKDVSEIKEQKNKIKNKMKEKEQRKLEQEKRVNEKMSSEMTQTKKKKKKSLSIPKKKENSTPDNKIVKKKKAIDIDEFE